ncbi:MAG: class I mannose-6-phosphate isomerase [Verrucomicrobiota bacterium]|nr:class I mannose-6-phosphate isomerase [Verrucomicrobiota bacterium]
MNTSLYPLRFEPVCQDYLWGGNRILKRYRRRSRATTCAESWEIADRSEGMSRVSHGPLAGCSLHALVARFGRRLLGAAGARSRSAGATTFPLLVKIIDARLRLSVQVHPHERNGRRGGAEPKTEMWYVLAAKPGSRICAGFRPGVGRREFVRAMARGAVARLLRSLPATPGCAFFIPGGRVHAIGKGCLLLEIQQNSHTTYRVYDWDRLDRDGKLRALHQEQALKVIRWTDRPTRRIRPRRIRVSPVGNAYDGVVRCPHFGVMRLRLRAPELVRHDGRSFHAYFVVAGRVRVAAAGRTDALPTGGSFLIPAALTRYRLEPLTRSAVLIRATL